jgi:hypothetical protein
MNIHTVSGDRHDNHPRDGIPWAISAIHPAFRDFSRNNMRR